MEKKWKNLGLVLLLLAIVIGVAFFFLKPPEIPGSSASISLQQGFSQIEQTLATNGLSFEKLKKAEIILVEDGVLVNDYSLQSFSKLEQDLLSLKTSFAQKTPSREKDALIKSIDLYLEVIAEEKLEKSIVDSVAFLDGKVTDFSTGCTYKDEFLELGQKQVTLSDNLSLINQKTNDFFLEFAYLEEIQILLIDVDPTQDIVDVYDFFSDMQDIDYACSIILEQE